MDPFLLIGGAGLVALLLRKRQVPQELKPQPMPEAPEGGGSITSLLGTAGAAAAGAAALSAGGAALGYAITGTVPGAIGGGLFPVQGNIVNAATQAGKEFDKMFGGSGTGGTGIVAQAGAGTAAAFAQVFGAAAAASAIASFLPVYLVWSIVEDLNRLAYGQAGAIRDFDKEWNVRFEVARSNFQGAFGTLPIREIERMATEFVDGYMLQSNRLQRLQWMKKPRGAGVTEAYHEKFGFERGYFVLSPVRRARKPEFLARLAAVDLVDVPGVTIPVPFGTPITMPAQKEDRFARTFEAIGRMFANSVAYAAHMREPRGFGQSETSHAAYGRDQGKFEGSLIAPNADLEFEGSVFTWNKAAKRPELAKQGPLPVPPPAAEPPPIKSLTAPLPTHTAVAPSAVPAPMPTVVTAPAPPVLTQVTVPTLQVQTLQGTTLAQKAKLAGF